MQNYAHGKIYTGRTFFLYRSSDIAIVACKRNNFLRFDWHMFCKNNISKDILRV